jgi:hypothetical protein
MKKKPKPSIGYRTNGKGRWWRMECQPKCSDKEIFGLECQGVWGHKGVHWAYRPDGSYSYWKNDSDPTSIREDIGAGWTPPEHDSYIHPKDKRTEYYRAFYSIKEVTEPTLIHRLENDDPPEDDAFVDRPLSPEETKRLEDEGKLPRLPNK